ncbi:LCP family protein [Adlercreutzia faecimuris]|uniref:LCP family protein n=1 Tax=Adlercreutzia faecimuris TaxID=2897341 RepID=A0ABS9WEZ5_9ACTN|nr:LCP family protein [Adlercreutzia sp. JBNU-10]MCI2241437.1 LCP family protein [Adlercreutzia sp. JBNU-10]
MERDPLPHADRLPDAGEEPPAEAAVTPAPDAPAPRRRLSARGKRLVAAGAIAVVGALVGAGLAFASYLANVNQELTQGDKTVEEVEEIEEALAHHSDFTEPFYLLLIGSDARPDDPSMGARSDTNILARVDPVADQVTLVSIPRDTKVTIPGHGTCKFNAAYAYGGVPGVIRATNDLLGVEVAHYAEVNFDKLMELVDALGGVDVEVDVRIDDVKADYNTYDRHNVIEPGLQHLDGSHALTFARSRAFPDGDFTRTAHQRTLIMAIVNQALGLSPTQLPAVVEAGAKCVTTDLTIAQVLDLALQFRDAGDLVIYSAMLPSFTQNIGGVSYVINDAEATAEMMALVEAGEDPSGIVSTKSAADVGGSGAATAPSAPAAPAEPEQPAAPAAPEQPPAAQPGGDAGAGTISGKPGAGEGAGGDAKPPAGGDGGGTDAGAGKPGDGAGDGGSSGGSAGSGGTKPNGGAGSGDAGAGGGAVKPDAGAAGGKQPAGGAPAESSAPAGSAAGAAAGKAA